MNIDDDTKRFIINRLKWLGLYLGIGLVLVLLLPFPYDFVSVLGIFILINLFRARNRMKSYGGTGGLGDLFSSLSSSSNRNNRVKYYCMSCGREHNDIACPNCGSKMKRVG